MKMQIKAVLAAVLLCALLALPGCTGKQLTQYNQDMQVAQQAVTVAEVATTQAAAVVDQVEAVAATQPTPAAEAAVAQAKAVLAKATQVEAQAQAALNLAVQIGQVLQSGSVATVDTSGLAAFGPYGTLVGILITGGLAIFKTAQNSGLLTKLETANKTVADHQVTIATLKATPAPAPAAPTPVPVAEPAVVKTA